MQVADCEDELAPVEMVDLVQEILVDDGGESLVQSCFESLWRLVGDFDCFLKQSEWELFVGLTGDPEPEVRVNWRVGIEHFDYFCHEL